MPKLSVRSLRYSGDFFSLFQQAQYRNLGNYYLSGGRFKSFSVPPSLTLQFYIPLRNAPYDVPRAAWIFQSIFRVYPGIVHDPHRGHYRVFSTFSPRYANALVGFFMQMSEKTKSKYLRFHYAEPFNYTFVLREPITFFPTIHPSFDYHDWVYPFEFSVRFSNTSEHLAFGNTLSIFHV
jgi:hypothetical protein